jgi:hypothetical protein
MILILEIVVFNTFFILKLYQQPICHSVGISTTYVFTSFRFLRNDKKLFYNYQAYGIL